MDTISYLRHAVSALTDEIGVRSYLDTDRLDRVTTYLTDQFASFGYCVSRQMFRYRGNTYHNIIAELRGSATPEKILVVGAHYDTVRTTPGADDNASGVAGVLSLARELYGSSVHYTIRFVAFALEEPPAYRTRNMGSYHYARLLKTRREQVEGMICLEMIGYFTDLEGSQHYPLPFLNLRYPRRGNFIAMVGNRKSIKFTKQIAGSFRNATDLPLYTLNAPAFVIGIDFSDHWSFGKFGFKALMVTDTAFYRNPHYHSPSDLPRTLDFDRMAQVVQGIKAALKDWN